MPKHPTHFEANGKDRRYLRRCAELLLRGRGQDERVAGMWFDRWLDTHMQPLSQTDSTTPPSREESHGADSTRTS